MQNRKLTDLESQLPVVLCSNLSAIVTHHGRASTRLVGWDALLKWLVQKSTGRADIYTRVRSTVGAGWWLLQRIWGGCQQKMTFVVIYWDQSVFLSKNLCHCFTSLIVPCKKKATEVKLVHKANSFAVLVQIGSFVFRFQAEGSSVWWL